MTNKNKVYFAPGAKLYYQDTSINIDSFMQNMSEVPYLVRTFSKLRFR
jgi:hypothetical protein